MLKTNIKTHLVVALASLLAFAVVLTAVHAKDLVKYSDTLGDLQLNDLSKKAASDLHNHVDKQVLKGFVKQVGDGNDTLRQRDSRELADHASAPQSLSELLENLLLRWQVRFAFAFATL